MKSKIFICARFVVFIPSIKRDEVSNGLETSVSVVFMTLADENQ